MGRTCPGARRGQTLLELLVVLVILLAVGTMMIPVLSWLGEHSQQVATRENLLRIRELLINKYYPEMGELPRPRLVRTTGTGPGGEPARMNHPQLVFLFVNPDTHEDGDATNDFITSTGNLLSGRRWQGPCVSHPGSEFYVTDTDTALATGTNYTSRYGVGDNISRIGDPTLTDAWGNPIVLQEPDINGDPTNVTQIERQHTRLVSPGKNGILDTPPDVLMPISAQRQDDLVINLFRHDENEDDHLTLNP